MVFLRVDSTKLADRLCPESEGKKDWKDISHSGHEQLGIQWCYVVGEAKSEGGTGLKD